MLLTLLEPLNKILTLFKFNYNIVTAKIKKLFTFVKRLDRNLNYNYYNDFN